MGLCGVVSHLLRYVLQLTAIAFVFTYVYILIGIIFFLSIHIRRLHDVGLSWMRLGSDYSLIQEGEKKGNEYGKPPKPSIHLKELMGF